MKQMIKISWMMLLLTLAKGSSSQIVHGYPLPGYPAAGTYSTHFAYPFSFTANLGHLALCTDFGAGIFSERKFLLQDLQNASMVIAIPSGIGGFGIEAGYYGSADYNESRVELAYGKKLSGAVGIGAGLHYTMMHVTGYSNAAAPGMELAILLQPSAKIKIGMQVTDPLGSRFGKTGNEKLESVYRFGLGYESTEQVFVNAEVIKEEDQPVSLHVALQYRFLPQFMVVTGILTGTATPYFGVGLSWKQFRIDLAVHYHLQLGFTPALVLIFENRRKD